MTKSPRRPIQPSNRSELNRSATDPARVLDKTVIAIPLLEALQSEREELAKKPNLHPRLHPIIIDLNLEFPGGRGAARDEVKRLIATLAEKRGRSLDEAISEGKSRLRSC